MHAHLDAVAALHDQLGKRDGIVIGHGQEFIISQQRGQGTLQLQHSKLLTCENRRKC